MSSDHFASGGPPFDVTAAPVTVVLKADRMRLHLVWRNGEKAEVSAARLRASCRCAWCTRARIEGAFSASLDDVAIDQLAPVGEYAINIVFSDGHARGIFPWTHLREIAQSDVISAAPVAAQAMSGAPLRGGPFE
jgi:DUF971 family protein